MGAIDNEGPSPAHCVPSTIIAKIVKIYIGQQVYVTGYVEDFEPGRHHVIVPPRPETVLKRETTPATFCWARM
jgi:hypothetical protein